MYNYLKKIKIFYQRFGGANQKGFTFVELLVAVSVFSILTIILSGIYVGFSNGQIRAKASQQLLNNGQYALEIMAREIRNNALFSYQPLADDKCGLGLSGADYEDCIILIKEDHQIVMFGWDEDTQTLEHAIVTCVSEGDYLPGIDCTIDRNNPQTNTLLLGPDLNEVNVERVGFSIKPNVNPYLSEIVNRQPQVTIQLKIGSAKEREVEQVSYSLQTSVSSRIYKR